VTFCVARAASEVISLRDYRTSIAAMSLRRSLHVLLLSLAVVLGLTSGAGTVDAAEPAVTERPSGTPQAAGGVRAETQARLEALGYSERAIDDPDPARRGVTVNEPGAAPGVNYYCTGSTVRFLTLDGKVLHEVKLQIGASPGAGCLAQLYGSAAVAVVASPLLSLSRLGSQPRWVQLGPYHHDVGFDADGLLYTLAKRDGVLQRHGQNVPIMSQAVVVLDPKGRVRRSVSLQPLFERFVPDERLRSIARLAPKQGTAEREEYVVATDVFHPNTLELVAWPHAPGRGRRALLSLRELDRVAVIDLDEQRLLWEWGADELLGPHDPWLLPSGNVLVFDNGARPTALGRWRGHSRLVEVDPRTGAIVWQYRGDPPGSFFSPSRGGAQPLPNGNLLVTESTKGRVFEITRAGEIVWEFWNTDFDDAGARRTIYRMHRISPEAYGALRGVAHSP